MPVYLHHYAEFACLLTAVICWWRTRLFIPGIFIPFLALTLAAELYATYLAHVRHLPNQGLYKILTTAAFVFYILVLSRFIENKKIKSAATLASLIIVFAVGLQNLFLPVNKFHREAYVFSSVLLIFYCFVYLYESLNKYDIDFRIEKRPAFWIVAGVLTFYLSGAAFIVFINSMPPGVRENFSLVMRWLSLVMYTSFIIAFILCQRDKEKYSI